MIRVESFDAWVFWRVLIETWKRLSTNEFYNEFYFLFRRRHRRDLRLDRQRRGRLSEVSLFREYRSDPEVATKGSDQAIGCQVSFRKHLNFPLFIFFSRAFLWNQIPLKSNNSRSSLAQETPKTSRSTLSLRRSTSTTCTISVLYRRSNLVSCTMQMLAISSMSSPRAIRPWASQTSVANWPTKTRSCSARSITSRTSGSESWTVRTAIR